MLCQENYQDVLVVSSTDVHSDQAILLIHCLDTFKTVSLSNRFSGPYLRDQLTVFIPKIISTMT